MKKILMCIVMMFSMITVANAENTSVMNAEAFHITVNTKALNRALEVNEDQAETVVTVMNMFDMQTNAVMMEKNENIRRNMLKSAISENVRLMRSVLSADQMRTYLKVLNVTLQNRGILK